jgi:branched-chain amino acid transport system permease protein
MGGPVIAAIGESYSRGRSVVAERPLTVVVGIAGLLLLFDLGSGMATGRYSVSRIGRFVWDGLMYGLIIGLAGIGLSLTYGILQFANFAHGDYITSGAFMGWGVTYVIAGLGSANVGHLLLVAPQGNISGGLLEIGVTSTPLAVLVGLVVAGLATILLVLLLDRIVYRPMRDAGGIPLLIASIGVAFALRYVVVLVYSTRTRGTTLRPPGTAINLVDGPLLIDAHDVTLLVATVALMIGVHLLLQRTKLGKAMRAMSDNRDLALVTGIPTERVIRWTWIIGGGLSGMAGYLMVLWTGTIDYQFGWLLLLLIFAAVILGGIGSVYGSIFGGLVIGIAMRLSLVWLPTGDFDLVAAFGIMILALLVKPQGLFAGRTTA